MQGFGSLAWFSQNLMLLLVHWSICSQFVANKAKGRISKRVFQESKARQNFRKTNISYPLIRTRTCAYQEVRSFLFGNFGVLCFLETPVLKFALLPYYQRIVNKYAQVHVNLRLFTIGLVRRDISSLAVYILSGAK